MDLVVDSVFRVEVHFILPLFIRIRLWVLRIVEVDQVMIFEILSKGILDGLRIFWPEHVEGGEMVRKELEDL